ncbi:MAG: hypothetical protein ABSB19_02735 [Methylomonas sp.]|jgi:hypothetical protein
MKPSNLKVILGVALISGCQLIWAQEPPAGPGPVPGPGGGQNPGEHHWTPPPEAYTACEGKEAGAAASFVNRRGDTVNGACQADKDGKLVVRREHPKN